MDEHTGGSVAISEGVQVRYDRGVILVDGIEISLTRTETGLLRLLANHAGKTFTRQQIVDSVRGADCPSTERSVDVHIRSLRAKLGRHHGVIQTVRGAGYRLRPLATNK